MCGVAGVMAGQGGDSPSLEELKRMIAMLGHRGPDGYGFYRDLSIGLGHARLSIIDLTTGGFQPIHNENRTVWIALNGEIFNHIELRRQLETRGHRFYTDTDTEVIVHAYEEWGDDAWERLNGQFAIALWDARARCLWLVRDRLGILPMHYARVGRHVVFGSEVKALVAGGRVEPRFDPARLAEVFTRWSAAQDATVFEGVRQVRAGEALRIDADLAITARRYWRPSLAVDPALAALTLNEAAEELAARLEQAVRLRLRADVPVGVYISGGLDSSVVASLVRREAPDMVQSFGIRFADPAFDETAQQRLVAGHLGTAHHEIMVGADDIQRVLPEVVWHCEAPLLRTAPAPLFLLSGLVRQSGIRVVQTGEGADEWLAGYDVFKEDQVRRFWARQPDSRLRPQLLARLHPFTAQKGAKGSALWQEFFRRGLTEVVHPFYSHLIRWRNTAWTLRLLAPEVRDGLELERMEAAVAADLPAGWRDWDPLARAQMIEIDTFLTAHLLSCQGDRVAMAHGVEARYPYLDPDVVDFCAGLPARLKLLGLRDKRPLRRLARRLLPDEIAQRPKRPYRAPMTTALFGTRAPDYVRDLLSDGALDRMRLVDGAAARLLVARAHRQDGRMTGEREEMTLVGLLTLQLLAHAFLEDFSARAAERRARLEDSPVHVLVERQQQWELE